MGRTIGSWQGWLIFFYSVPSRPVSSRMKIWRKLAKAGAVQMKGAVYVLPMTEEHYEFFQWLVTEVVSMGGEAAFTRIGAFDSIKDEAIRALFNEQRSLEYLSIEKTLSDLETKTNSIKKGSRPQNHKSLIDQHVRLSRNYEETAKKDFFGSSAGAALHSRIAGLDSAIRGLKGSSGSLERVAVQPKRAADFQGKIWVTRKRPFVDRMASAWLIRNFIDRKAVFELVHEKDMAAAGKWNITFDLTGGDFTHVGDLCTFEVLVRAFGIKDKAVRKIAEIVHELDIRDDKYRNPESAGVEQILAGLRRSVSDDMELLEKGMSVFEMLYLARNGS